MFLLRLWCGCDLNLRYLPHNQNQFQIDNRLWDFPLTTIVNTLDQKDMGWQLVYHNPQGC